jgi:hypothetical protein
VVLFALIAAACAAPSVPGLESAGARGYAEEKLAQPISADDADQSTASDDERMIVYTGELSLVVGDAEESLGQIKSIVGALDGYVADTRLWREEEQVRGWVTVRVPAESVDNALTQFKALAVSVERETSGTEDVTEEYTDLGARLRNLEATEQELLELLKTVRERTGKAEEILAVHREITSVRGQIEQLKGRMQYLEKTSSMAAITVELIPDALAQPISVRGWQPRGTLANALRSLLRTLQLIGDAGIWVIFYVLPVVLVLLFPLTIVWLVWRRKRRRQPREEA